MTLEAGRLRHRINIQEQRASQDPVTGEIVKRWVTKFENVPAEIVPLSVKEFMAAQQMKSEIVVRITIRYRAGLDARQRIIHKDSVYAPAGFLPDKISNISYVTIPCSLGVRKE